MSQAPLRAIFTAMADKISAACAAELPDLDVQVTDIRNFNPTPPSVDIWYGDPSRDETVVGAGFQELAGPLLVTVRVRVGTADNPAGQDLLLRFMDEVDDIGIAPALMDDQTLNGLAGSVYVEGCSGQQLWVGPDGPDALLGASWRVRVLREYS